MKSKVIGRCGGDEKTNDHAEKNNPCKTELFLEYRISTAQLYIPTQCYMYYQYACFLMGR